MAYLKKDPTFVSKRERVRRIRHKQRCTYAVAKQIYQDKYGKAPIVPTEAPVKTNIKKTIERIRRKNRCTYRQAKEIYLERESTKEVKKKYYETVYIEPSNLCYAINLLNQKEEPRKNVIAMEAKKRCQNIPCKSLVSMSYSNIALHMKHCILRHDWVGLTQLLIIFFDASTKYEGIKWKNAIINILNNPNVKKFNLMDEFLEMVVRCQTPEDKELFLKYVTSPKMQLFNEPILKIKNSEEDTNIDVTKIEDDMETTKLEEIEDPEDDVIINFDDYFPG